MWFSPTPPRWCGRVDHPPLRHFFEIKDAEVFFLFFILGVSRRTSIRVLQVMFLAGFIRLRRGLRPNGRGSLSPREKKRCVRTRVGSSQVNCLQAHRRISVTFIYSDGRTVLPAQTTGPARRLYRLCPTFRNPDNIAKATTGTGRPRLVPWRTAPKRFQTCNVQRCTSASECSRSPHRVHRNRRRKITPPGEFQAGENILFFSRGLRFLPSGYEHAGEGVRR